MSTSWDGLLAVDKPSGPTSHDLVSWVRTSGGTRRVGHTGTLDPPATGLLLLVLGRATRLAQYVPDAPKTYCGALELGVTTTTDDLSGDVLDRREGPLPEPAAVLEAAALLLGRQLQVPPAFSARQVGGTRMYRLARRGISVEAPATPISVERFALQPTDTPRVWSFEIVVSTGTYVRALVRDLGRALGCGAAVASLRRTVIGPLDVTSALPLPERRATLSAELRSRIIPIDAMPLVLPSIAIDAPGVALRFASGVAVPDPEPTPDPALAAVRTPDGRLLGVGRRGDGMIKPRLVLGP